MSCPLFEVSWLMLHSDMAMEFQFKPFFFVPLEKECTYVRMNVVPRFLIYIIGRSGGTILYRKKLFCKLRLRMNKLNKIEPMFSFLVITLHCWRSLGFLQPLLKIHTSHQYLEDLHWFEAIFKIFWLLCFLRPLRSNFKVLIYLTLQFFIKDFLL